MEKLIDKKNIAGWEEVVSLKSSAYEEWFKEEKDFLRKNLKKDAEVLEVSCGSGRGLLDIPDITTKITGVDHDEDAIKKAKINLKNFPNTKLILAEGKKLPFKEGSFDNVLCIGTFANFGEEKQEILGEIKRVLKKEGKILLTVYAENALNERLKAYKKAKLKIKKVLTNGTVIFDDFGADGISEQFSKEELIEIFSKAGLKTEEIKKASIVYLCKLSKK